MVIIKKTPRGNQYFHLGLFQYLRDYNEHECIFSKETRSFSSQPQPLVAQTIVFLHIRETQTELIKLQQDMN